MPLRYVDDSRETRRRTSSEIIQKNSKLSTSFITLLIGSTVISTLGLLLNAPAVIIGGMIISPLMWPLLELALGVSYGKTSQIKNATLVSLGAILIVILSAALITYISPIKQINAEILARTQPTFLDIIIALAAGAVATLAVINHRISASLAGVAIAASLLPPLSVSAIGLALFNMMVFRDALLLFFANVASIVFISSIMFSIMGYKKKRTADVRLKGLLTITAILVVISNPLLSLLEIQSFELGAYPKVEDEIERFMEKTHPLSAVDNIRLTYLAKENLVAIEAQIWLPDEDRIDFGEQRQLIGQLEERLGKPISLNLRLQRALSLATEVDQVQLQTKRDLSESFARQMASLYPNLSLDSLDIFLPEYSNIWEAKAVIRGGLSESLDQTDRFILEEKLQQAIGKKVRLEIEYIPHIVLSGRLDSDQDLEKQLRDLLTELLPSSVEIKAIAIDTPSNLDSEPASGNLSPDKPPILKINVLLLTPPNVQLTPAVSESLQQQLAKQLNQTVLLSLESIKTEPK